MFMESADWMGPLVLQKKRVAKRSNSDVPRRAIATNTMRIKNRSDGVI